MTTFSPGDRIDVTEYWSSRTPRFATVFQVFDKGFNYHVDDYQYEIGQWTKETNYHTAYETQYHRIKLISLDYSPEQSGDTDEDI